MDMRHESAIMQMQKIIKKVVEVKNGVLVDF